MILVKAQKYVLKVLEVCQMLSKQWEKVLIRDIQGTSEAAIR